jgi:hypothetical protein
VIKLTPQQLANLALRVRAVERGYVDTLSDQIAFKKAERLRQERRKMRQPRSESRVSDALADLGESLKTVEGINEELTWHRRDEGYRAYYSHGRTTVRTAGVKKAANRNARRNVREALNRALHVSEHEIAEIARRAPKSHFRYRTPDNAAWDMRRHREEERERQIEVLYQQRLAEWDQDYATWERRHDAFLETIVGLDFWSRRRKAEAWRLRNPDPAKPSRYDLGH